MPGCCKRCVTTGSEGWPEPYGRGDGWVGGRASIMACTLISPQPHEKYYTSLQRHCNMALIARDRGDGSLECD
ncbi:hypothetical protein SPHINGO361_110050 [Sphingomonas sp. EC-HK361]|nr:hypothetical protein SPHINGO361_110050 [Sphingomonas sp. EC-HK361]